MKLNTGAPDHQGKMADYVEEFFISPNVKGFSPYVTLHGSRLWDTPAYTANNSNTWTLWHPALRKELPG
jgi:hypothetical protein